MRTVIFAGVLMAMLCGQFSVLLGSAQQVQANAQPAPSKTPYYPTTYIYQESRRGLRLDNDGPPAPVDGAQAERSSAVRAIVREKTAPEPEDVTQ